MKHSRCHRPYPWGRAPGWGWGGAACPPWGAAGGRRKTPFRRWVPPCLPPAVEADRDGSSFSRCPDTWHPLTCYGLPMSPEESHL